MSDQALPLLLARATIPSITVDYTAVPVTELVVACAAGQAVAWQEFIRRYHRIVSITAFRVAQRWGEASPQVVDDLAQDTYLKLCGDGSRILREFHCEHPDAILGFLKVVTANVANDYFKRLHAGKRGGSLPAESLEDSDVAMAAKGPAGLTDAERSLLLGEVDSCLRSMTGTETRERDLTIFRLYYRQGLTAKEIVELPSIGLSLKGVESTLHRLTQFVRTRLVEARPKKMSAG